MKKYFIKKENEIEYVSLDEVFEELKKIITKGGK